MCAKDAVPCSLRNIGTSICSNILYKHNIVLRMYCMLLLYNLPSFVEPIQHTLKSCPSNF